MNFISLDLEWNSVLNEETGKYINEIIEIGACKLNDKLEEIDSIDLFIKPVVTKTLNDYVKKLTHITDDALKTGISFDKAMDKLSKFASANSLVMTWSNTDLYVLLDNFKVFKNRDTIPFLKKYMDLQKYVSRFLVVKKGEQVSASNAASMIGIDLDEFNLHRALDDSRLCAEMLRFTYDKAVFASYISDTSKGDFYKRLNHKTCYITNLKDPDIDKSALELTCRACGKKARRDGAFQNHKKSFKAHFSCDTCKKRFVMQVRFKKTYDGIVVNRSIRTLDKKKTEEGIAK